MTGPAAVYYKKGTGESMVYGGGFIALLSGLVALRSGVPALLILSGIAALAAAYHWPMMDKRPALAFDAKGLYVQGVGVVRWDLIEDIKRADKPVRTLLNPHLAIQLKEGWRSEPLPHGPNTLTRFLRPAGRIRGDELNIPLEGLRAEPDPLTQAIEQHWRAA